MLKRSEVDGDPVGFSEFIRGCMRREPTVIIVGECLDRADMGSLIDAANAGVAQTTILAFDFERMRRALELKEAG